MKTIRQNLTITYLFSVLAIATSLMLVVDAPKIVRYAVAVFWFFTGLLGFYSSRKR